MSKGLFNWSSYTEKKESKFASPKKGEDTIPKPKSPKSKLYSSCKEQKVRVIRIYLKHRSGYIVGQLEENVSIKEKAINIIEKPNRSLIISSGMYVGSDRVEILRQEEMSDFYIKNSSIDFLEEGKGWLVEDAKKEGDD